MSTIPPEGDRDKIYEDIKKELGKLPPGKKAKKEEPKPTHVDEQGKKWFKMGDK